MVMLGSEYVLLRITCDLAYLQCFIFMQCISFAVFCAW